MAFKNIRTIHTNLYGDRAFDIIDALHGQLSDGLFENSRGYDKYWMNFHVKRDVDNEIVFEVNNEYGIISSYSYVPNPFTSMSDRAFCEWYAYKIKTVIKAEAKDNSWAKGWWKRDNCSDTSIYLNRKLDVTVADIYCTYEALLGREIGITKYGSNTICRIFGTKSTDEEIASKIASEKQKNDLIKMKNEALAKAKAEYDAKVAEINLEYVID